MAVGTGTAMLISGILSAVAAGGSAVVQADQAGKAADVQKSAAEQEAERQRAATAGAQEETALKSRRQHQGITQAAASASGPSASGANPFGAFPGSLLGGGGGGAPGRSMLGA